MRRAPTASVARGARRATVPVQPRHADPARRDGRERHHGRRRRGQAALREATPRRSARHSRTVRSSWRTTSRSISALPHARARARAADEAAPPTRRDRHGRPLPPLLRRRLKGHRLGEVAQRAEGRCSRKRTAPRTTPRRAVALRGDGAAVRRARTCRRDDRVGGRRRRAARTETGSCATAHGADRVPRRRATPERRSRRTPTTSRGCAGARADRAAAGMATLPGRAFARWARRWLRVRASGRAAQA